MKAADISESDSTSQEKIRLKVKGITLQAFQNSKAFGGLLPTGMGALYYHYSGHRLMCIIDIFDAIAHYFQCHPDHPDKDKELDKLESLSLRDSQLHRCTIQLRSSLLLYYSNQGMMRSSRQKQQ